MKYEYKWLVVPDALLTTCGTVLGFIVSYRASQSFARYNQGRQFWTTIIIATRNFSRTLWFQVSNRMPVEGMSDEEQMARALMEKKTVLNLVEAYAVAIKHYLRSEDGIYYTDLYHLVKFLPAYSLPGGIVPSLDQHGMDMNDPAEAIINPPSTPRLPMTASLPLPVTSQNQFRLSAAPAPRGAVPPALNLSSRGTGSPMNSPRHGWSVRFPRSPNPATPITPKTSRPVPPRTATRHEGALAEEDEIYLIPAYKPPRFQILELWPFSILKGRRIRSAKNAKGERARKIRAKMMNKADTHNLPLEISLYIGSYIGALQRRKTEDPMTINHLLQSLNQLSTALAGLERILSTPVPYSYRIHLWVILCCYCLALPLQIVKKMEWYTIPGVILFAAVFFGFLVAGEEIENPFGYARNDLNLDHFTGNIIRNELHAISSAPPPDPKQWAFVSENDLVFGGLRGGREERISPETWVQRGYPRMQAALRAM